MSKEIMSDEELEEWNKTFKCPDCGQFLPANLPGMAHVNDCKEHKCPKRAQIS